MSPSYETLILERGEGYAIVRLNRPDKRNSIGGAMMSELHACLRGLAQDRSLRVVVLRGEGADFCPGADVKHYGSSDPAASQRPAWSPVTEFDIAVLLHEMHAVTIAAVAGACAGAGFGWACACDLRVASETARFNTAFLDVGVAGDMGLPWTLPRILGAAKARELCFLPGKFDAREAERIGLVSRVSAADAFEADLAALVARLAGAAPLALGALKSNFTAAERMGFSDYIALESERHVRLFQSQDTTEAFRAYVEKRPPRFVGR